MSAAELVAPGVRRLLAPNPGMMTGPGTNTYLLGDARVAVVDPGPAAPPHLNAIEAAAGKVAAIWLTHAHPDHADAVSPLKARTGAPLAAWPVPAPTYAIAGLRAPEQPVADGDVLVADDEAWTALHCPGHASDHLCFFRARDGVLIAGDVVVSQGTVVIAPPDGDLVAYLASLERLAALGASVILPGHGDPIADPAAKLAEYRAHRLAREQQVLDRLAAGDTAIGAIVAAIYADVDPALQRVAAKQVAGHLGKLVGEGRVVGDEAGYRLA